MAKRPALSDEENAAFVSLLRGWKEGGEDYRAIGDALGYPLRSGSQSISGVAREKPAGRIGADMRDRILKRLGVSREDFLRARGLIHLIEQHAEVTPLAKAEPVVEPERIERVLRIAAKLGRPAADALSVYQGLAALTGSITDEEIARRFEPQTLSGRVVENDDDLLGGIAAMPKLPSRGRKRQF